jgi:hypothetical protein
VPACPNERSDLSRGVDHVLEVVEQEQEALGVDLAGQVSLGAEHFSSSRKHERRVGQGGERHPPDPLGVALGGCCRRLQGQAGFAGSARARERHQPNVVTRQQFARLRELAVPAHERRRRDGEVRLVKRLQTRELGVAELPDPLLCRQVLQPVLAEVAQVVSPRQVAGGL